MKQISARLRSLAHLIPIWFTLFAAIFLAANYGSSVICITWTTAVRLPRKVRLPQKAGRKPVRPLLVTD